MSSDTTFTPRLDRIVGPSDLKHMKDSELAALAGELRNDLVEFCRHGSCVIGLQVSIVSIPLPGSPLPSRCGVCKSRGLHNRRSATMHNPYSPVALCVRTHSLVVNVFLYTSILSRMVTDNIRGHRITLGK